MSAELCADAELVLKWISQTGSGSIRQLADRLKWLNRTRDHQLSSFAAINWIRSISDLGYVEIDWDNDLWAVTLPAIVRLPNIDELAFVTGERVPGLRRLLEQNGAELHEVQHLATSERMPPPPSLFLQVDSLDDLQLLATSADINYAGCAAKRIAPFLPRVTLDAEAAPPSNAAIDKIEKLDLVSGGTFKLSTVVGDGLYRFRTGWRNQYLFRRADRWYHTRYSSGFFLEASRVGRKLIGWHPAEFGDGSDGAVRIQRQAMLPPLQARCLTLCSGLPPEPSDSYVVYENVPRVLAENVALSLDQELAID